MTVKEVLDPQEKQRIARTVLEALTEWFEVPETREDYIQKVKDLPLFWDEANPCQIYVMALK